MCAFVCRAEGQAVHRAYHCMICCEILTYMCCMHRRYLVFTVNRNEDFTQLWIIDSSKLPVSPTTGALDLSQFQGQCGNISALPIIKLVDNFDAVYELLFTDGEIFTIATTVNSTGKR